MNQTQRKNPFWRLAGPLLAYLALQWAVQFVIMLVICIPYVPGAYADLMRTGAGRVLSMQEVMEVYVVAMEPAFTIIERYQIEIMGAAALSTLILTYILLKSDRKLEKANGIAASGRKPVSAYVLIFLMGAAGSIGMTCLIAMAQLAFLDSQYQQTAQVLYAAGFPVRLAVLGILIPVSEEMMFRGILFKRFREMQGFWYSAVCSSIFFAFIHTNATQTVTAFLLGLMLSYLYERFGSFKAPVLLHITINTGSLVFTDVGLFRWLGTDPARVAGAAIAGAFICSVVFVAIQRILGDIRKDDPRADRQNPLDMFW